MGLELLTPQEVAQVNPRVAGVSGYRIPYRDLEGKLRKGIYRVRLLGDPVYPFSAKPEKPLRYLQPKDTPPALYLPPTYAMRPWPAVALDPSIDLLVTEGEKKAAAAGKVGFACVGLGGVSSFQSKRLGWRLLPELEAFVWEQRIVYIVFDSDLATNSDVARAAAAFAKELSSRGALPRIVAIPSAADGGKMALDDVLLGGTGPLRELLSESSTDELTRQLWRYNGRFTFVLHPGAIHDNETGNLYDPGKFQTSLFAQETAEVVETTAAGEPRVREVVIPEAWVHWPARRQVPCLTYEPGREQLVDGALNVWPGWGCAEAEGSVAPWHDLLDYLLKGATDDERIWFERWCLYPIARPGTKLLHAAGLWSQDQGVGKSLVGKTLGRVYGLNYAEVGQRDLESPFNGWQVHKQLVMVDDVSAYDSRAKADLLKKFITQESIEVNLKHIATYQLRDKCNLYLTSNHANAFFIEDNDRRWFVHEVTSGKREVAFYERYHAWIYGDGPSHLLWYARHAFDLGDFKPHEPPPVTTSKLEMVRAAKNEIDLWVSELADDPASKLRFGSVALTQDVFSSAEILLLFEPSRKGPVITVNVLARLLRSHFRMVGPLTVDGVAERFFVVRHPGKWLTAKSKELIKHIAEARAQRAGRTVRG